jgi:hypothetical protein
MPYKYIGSTWSFGGKYIRKVEIEKETEKNVWIRGSRRAKSARGEIICDTWAEAHEFLISEATRKAKVAQEALTRFLKELDKIQDLTETESS